MALEKWKGGMPQALESGPDGEKKTLCPTGHSGAASEAGSPYLTHPPLQSEVLAQTSLTSHATEPRHPASYWSLDVPVSQVSFELEIPSFPLHSAPCVKSVSLLCLSVPPKLTTSTSVVP